MQSDKYYGFYSNKTRGTRKAKGEATGPAGAQAPAQRAGAAGAPPQTEGSQTEADRAPAEVRRNWARLIRKVWEVDPLICVRCGGTMKVIALIERPAVVKRILDHLHLSTPAAPDRSPPSPTAAKGQTCEPLFDDLPWEEPTFEDTRLPENDEPTLDADRHCEDDAFGEEPEDRAGA